MAGTVVGLKHSPTDLIFVGMQTVEELVAAAKKLPAIQREELCEQIASSLDVPLSVEEAAWAELAERRAEELRTGKIIGVAAEDSLARLDDASDCEGNPSRRR